MDENIRALRQETFNLATFIVAATNARERFCIHSDEDARGLVNWFKKQDLQSWNGPVDSGDANLDKQVQEVIANLAIKGVHDISGLRDLIRRQKQVPVDGAFPCTPEGNLRTAFGTSAASFSFASGGASYSSSSSSSSSSALAAKGNLNSQSTDPSSSPKRRKIDRPKVALLLQPPLMMATDYKRALLKLPDSWLMPTLRLKVEQQLDRVKQLLEERLPGTFEQDDNDPSMLVATVAESLQIWSDVPHNVYTRDDLEGVLQEINTEVTHSSWRMQNYVRPNCLHGKECNFYRVKKEGRNKGRGFYTCPDRVKGCSFVWADGLDNEGRDLIMRSKGLAQMPCSTFCPRIANSVPKQTNEIPEDDDAEDELIQIHVETFEEMQARKIQEAKERGDYVALLD